MHPQNPFLYRPKQHCTGGLQRTAFTVAAMKKPQYLLWQRQNHQVPRAETPLEVRESYSRSSLPRELRKYARSCIGSENHSSLLSRTNYIFVFFFLFRNSVLSHRKLNNLTLYGPPKVYAKSWVVFRDRRNVALFHAIEKCYFMRCVFTYIHHLCDWNTLQSKPVFTICLHAFFNSRCYLKGGYAIEKNWTTVEGDASTASHDIGARNAIETFWSRPTSGDVASAASQDIGARNAIEHFEEDQLLEMLQVSLVTVLAREMRLFFFLHRPSFRDAASAASTILAREMRLKFFEVDRRCCECMSLVTVLARGKRLKIFWSRPNFRDVVSAACHDIGARNVIEIFWNRPTFGDVASAAGHDIGARNAIENVWSRPMFGDVASAASHDIGARNAIENVWSRPMFGDVASAASHDIGAREMRLKSFRRRSNFGDVASATSHEIRARNVIESFFNCISCQ